MKYIAFVLLICLCACGGVKEFIPTPEEEKIINEIPNIFAEEPTVEFEKIKSINNTQGDYIECNIDLSISQLSAGDLESKRQMFLAMSAYHFYSKNSNIQAYRYINVSLTEENTSDKIATKYSIKTLRTLDTCINSAKKFMNGLQQLNADTLYNCLGVELQQKSTKEKFKQLLIKLEKEGGKSLSYHLVGFELITPEKDIFLVKFNMYWKKERNENVSYSVDVKVNANSKEITGFNL